jgi:hypothetical protein
MAFWGTTPPIIKYGPNFLSALSLSETDCSYRFSWSKDRELYHSVLTGRITPYEKAPFSNYGRMTAEITLFNLTPVKMRQFCALRSETTLRLILHPDQPEIDRWTVDFIVEQYQPFASGESGLPYPEFDSAYLKLTSQDYVDLKDFNEITP